MSVSFWTLLEVGLEAHAHVGVGTRDELGRQIAVGGHDEERRAVQRVGARREDGDALLAPLDLEVDVGSDRAADPVALHLEHLLRPEALELVEVVEQAVGVVGDLEVPLRELLLHDLGAAALAVTVDDLLVREHGLVVGAPVDGALLAVGETALVQPLEQPLVPVVVLRVARVQNAGPVERHAIGAEAGLLLRDVRVGPLARVRAALDGGVLGRQSERVPADRVEDVVAAVAPDARHDVGVQVVLGVPHVQVAGRVREHRQHVLARAGVVVAAGAERVRLGPARLPLLLDGVRVVAASLCRGRGVGGKSLTHGEGPIVGCREHAEGRSRPKSLRAILQITGPRALTSRAAAPRRAPRAARAP